MLFSFSVVQCGPFVFLTWLVLQLTAVASRWPAEKHKVLHKHPLYRRTLRHDELPELKRTFDKVAALPVSDARFRIAYLIQGEEDSSSAEEAMWSNCSHVFKLTFRSRHDDALFFPGSIYTEGRNALLAAAAHEELRSGWRYTYYVILDADAEATPRWPVAVRRFGVLLKHWEPAVAVPAYDGPSGIFVREPHHVGKATTDVFNFDHIFLAVHTEAARALLPYDSTLDHDCWWVSSWALTLLALALFRDHVLMFPSIRIKNPAHSTYPKRGCVDQMANVSARFRRIVVAELRSCFPDPVSTVILQHGELKTTSYLSWGKACRKGGVSYGISNINNATSCDDEQLIQDLRQESVAPWCRGCDRAEAFYLLQGIVAAHPYRAEHWNELAVWLAAFGRYSTAFACLAIARRLLLRRHMPPHALVERNVEHVVESAMITDAWLPKEQDLWEEGAQLCIQAINAALHVAHAPDQRFLTDGSIRLLVDILTSETLPCFISQITVATL